MKAKSMIDRLSLDHDRLLGMADGLRQIAKLADPIGEVMSMAKRPNGLIIGKRRVAIGVVGIILRRAQMSHQMPLVCALRQATVSY